MKSFPPLRSNVEELENNPAEWQDPDSLTNIRPIEHYLYRIVKIVVYGDTGL